MITTKTVKSNPQFTVQLSNWKTQPTLTGMEFGFHAAAGAKPVTSVTSSCAAGAR